MMSFVKAALTACLLVAAGSTQAAVLFSEDFSDEAATYGTQLNFTNFDQFNVNSGTVDLIAAVNPYGITCETGGCIDLDGSNSSAGFISSTAINFLVGVTYKFVAVISGNQRNQDADTTFFGINNSVLAKSIRLEGGDGFQTLEYIFTVDSAKAGAVFFSHLGGDNYGLILDRVSVESVDGGVGGEVPLPATLSLMLLGLGGLGLGARRRRG